MGTPIIWRGIVGIVGSVGIVWVVGNSHAPHDPLRALILEPQPEPELQLPWEPGAANETRVPEEVSADVAVIPGLPKSARSVRLNASPKISSVRRPPSLAR